MTRRRKLVPERLPRLRRLLTAGVLFASWSVPATVVADPLPERSARVVDYDIAVELDAPAHQLTGRQRVTWRNPSTDTVDELWFHLYLNAFRNSLSTFYRESGGKLRRDEMPADGWGWIEIDRFALPDGTDLLRTLEYQQPDDGNKDDLTVAKIDLPTAVGPGGEVTVEIDFRVRLPKVFARTGHAGDFVLAGQWYPKLGVYEPAGRRGRVVGGWNCHQFHANSEFYADYGSFRVEITVPADHLVGATGQHVASRPGAAGTTVHVYQQDDVHDFAWTADPSFVEVVDQFVADREVSADELATKAALLDRSVAEVQLADVEIRLLLQPEHRSQASRYLAAAKVALKELGLAYGRYPYPTLTVVDPPTIGEGAGGMEYPTFVTGGTRTQLAFWPLSGIRLVEAVTVHEIGHQFFYGLVGSNEFEESWLDEGFTTYATALALDAGYGVRTASLDLPGLALGAAELDGLGNHHERRFDSIRTPSWGFSRGQYGFNSYSRPALVLRTLAGLLGEQTMARVMRTYAERWRFGHPSSDDFYAVAAEVAGQDLDWFFAQVVESPGVFDPAVVSVETTRERPPRGRLWRRDGWVDVSEDDATDPVQGEASAKASGDGERWVSRVELRQLGEVNLPVDVELRFAAGPPERRTWDGDKRWARWDVVRDERLVEVVIDPDRLLALDASRLNNTRRVESDPRTAVFGASKLLFWAQQLLAAVGL